MTTQIHLGDLISPCPACNKDGNISGASKIENMIEFGRPICDKCGGHKYVLTTSGKVLREFAAIIARVDNLK